jgi:hypothetical protein
VDATRTPLSAEHALDGVNEEEAICGGLITKAIPKIGLHRKFLSFRARANFTAWRLISEASLPVFRDETG